MEEKKDRKTMVSHLKVKRIEITLWDVKPLFIQNSPMSLFA